MTKQEEFLWIVQTAVLANGINLSTTPSKKEEYKTEYSSSGVRSTMREAIRASGLIPSDMDAADAADDFCIYMFRNIRDSLDDDDELKTVPYWFARS